MNANVKFVIDLIVAMVVPSSAISAAVWRASIKIRDNTRAVAELAAKVDGTVVTSGLLNHVRVLEDKILTAEVRRDVEAERG